LIDTNLHSLPTFDEGLYSYLDKYILKQSHIYMYKYIYRERNVEIYIDKYMLTLQTGNGCLGGFP
jgi:hypothetical protein